MAWLSIAQKNLFKKFLDQSPPLNNHKNISTRYVCFYSSELKNLKQCVDCLVEIEQGRLQGKDRSSVRYRNSLENWGLIKLQSNKYVLSKSGESLLKHAKSNNLLGKAHFNLNEIISLDDIIFSHLIESALKGQVEEDFARKLVNAQLFLENIPEKKVGHLLKNLDLLYFLQIIHSEGSEIKKFFNLSSSEQKNASEDFKNLIKKTSFPKNVPPKSEQQIYLYLRPAGKNNIQKDIRFRVCSFLFSYLKHSKKLGNKFPRFDDNLKPIFTKSGKPKPIKPQKKVLSKKLSDNLDDEAYQTEINSGIVKKSLPTGPIKPPSKSKKSSSSKYQGDPAIARTKLANSNWICENNKNHKTFICKTTNMPYMEGHHLIPMSAQGDFLSASLDVPENILCLCPTCHRKSHHSKPEEKTKLISRFYGKNKEELKNRGIDISLTKLKEYYKC